MAARHLLSSVKLVQKQNSFQAIHGSKKLSTQIYCSEEFSCLDYGIACSRIGYDGDEVVVQLFWSNRACLWQLRLVLKVARHFQMKTWKLKIMVVAAQVDSTVARVLQSTGVGC